jgi:hypothetical protein
LYEVRGTPPPWSRVTVRCDTIDERRHRFSASTAETPSETRRTVSFVNTSWICVTPSANSPEAALILTRPDEVSRFLTSQAQPAPRLAAALRLSVTSPLDALQRITLPSSAEVRFSVAGPVRVRSVSIGRAPSWAGGCII